MPSWWRRSSFTHQEKCLSHHLCSYHAVKQAPCNKKDVMQKLNSEITNKADQLLHADPTGGDDDVQQFFGCVASSAGEGKFEDCIPPDTSILSDIGAGYYFRTDATGRPGELSVSQWRGEIIFEWTDFSSCEQAFSLTRKDRLLASSPWGPEQSFTEDYYVQGATTCDERIIPSDRFDDLTGLSSMQPKRLLGLHQDYCVSASAENGASAITYVMIQWL